MALNLDTIFADFNGTSLAIAGAGEWGFIPDEYRLGIPQGMVVPNPHVLGVTPFATLDDSKNFLKANYALLVAGGIVPTVAYQISIFRLLVATEGMLTSSLADRSVVEDEYVIVANQGANWADALNAIPAFAGQTNINKHYKRYGMTYIHMMCYVFLSRGHHYKQEYNDLYDRLKTACFIPNNPGFQILTNEQMFRLSIHGFGISPLVELSMHHAANSDMAAAMLIRYSPATPISGVAHITTLAATVSHMAKEPWFGAFATKFAAPIQAIADEVELILATPLVYHVSAKFLGQVARTLPSAESQGAFNTLCQFALGYIDHLGRRHSLAGQQAITKKSGGITGLGDGFSKACDKFGKPGVDVNSMTAFLAQI